MNVTELPDEDLAVYVREVDLDAYREVVNRYEVPLMRYAQFMLGNSIVSAEIVQNAFIAGYKNIHSFNQRQSFSNFIYRQAHLVLSAYFKKKHQTVGLYEDLSEEFESEDDTEHEFADKELLQHIKKYAHRLPIKYKEALVLHFIARKSYAEVSDILQIPISSVSVRIGLGKNIIQRHAKN